ncbi:hypothetical protein DC522_28490 [Microvirga sp. KLBC 81]|nr:hypothetical protein DC522_28490 [Microvirga sp. KLBC 81]
MFVPDIKRNVILSWRRTGYTYLKREGTNDKAWVALGDQAAPVLTVDC